MNAVAEREKKLRPFSRAWEKAAVELALSYAPRIGACYGCKQPTAAGYCCSYCGSGEGCHDNEGNRI